MDDLYRRIGSNIRRRRRALRLKQEELALEAGLSRGSISNIEGGRQQLYVHHLLHIAQALRVSAVTLLEEAGQLDREAIPLLQAAREGRTAR